MAEFVKGDIVVVPFPFTDLTQAKRRPALVLAALEGDDIILCQITSKSIHDSYSIHISVDDFITGSLHQSSNVRPNRLFTADKDIVLYKVGRINSQSMHSILERVLTILQK